MRNDAKLLRGYLEPDVERFDELAAEVLARVGRDIVERFQDGLLH